jgi:hypothetical protein
MEQFLDSAAHRPHVMAGPPVPDVLAVPLQLRDQGREVRIMRMARGGKPEPAEHGPGLGFPVQVHLPGAVGHEHPAHQVALASRQFRPVGEQLPRGRVGGQHVPAAPFHERRKRLKALDQVGHLAINPLGWRRPGYVGTGRAVVPVSQNLQVAALGGRHPQGRCQGIKHLCGGPHRASLLKKGVVGDGQVRQLGDLLAAQASRAPPAPRRQTDIAGHEPLAPRPEQLPEGPGISRNRHAIKPTHASTSKGLLWLPVPPVPKLGA